VKRGNPEVQGKRPFTASKELSSSPSIVESHQIIHLLGESLSKLSKAEAQILKELANGFSSDIRDEERRELRQILKQISFKSINLFLILDQHHFLREILSDSDRKKSEMDKGNTMIGASLSERKNAQDQRERHDNQGDKKPNPGKNPSLEQKNEGKKEMHLQEEKIEKNQSPKSIPVQILAEPSQNLSNKPTEITQENFFLQQKSTTEPDPTEKGSDLKCAYQSPSFDVKENIKNDPSPSSTDPINHQILEKLGQITKDLNFIKGIVKDWKAVQTFSEGNKSPNDDNGSDAAAFPIGNIPHFHYLSHKRNQKSPCCCFSWH